MTDLVRIAPAPAPSNAHPDLALAEAVLRRDRKAAAEWVDRFSGPVHSYVRARLLPRTDLVDDVVQEVFITAWKHLSGYRGGASMASWLMGIARHKVEDHYRERLRACAQWDDEGPEPADTAPPVEDLIDRERCSERLRAAMASMPEHYAAILYWRYWERRGAREIAAATGQTEKAVERMLSRARENLRRRWPDAGPAGRPVA